MKFSCTQENLHQGLSVVSHISGKNINLPILGNVLLKGDDSGLHLISTNLEIAVQCLVRGKMESQGEFTVPSKLFSEYIALLPKERVDVEIVGTTMVVGCGSFQTKMNGIPASEFPLIPAVEGKWKFTLRTVDLRRAISQVLFAVAPNESRPEISGVLFKFSPADPGLELILAATDSYRLAERVIHVDSTRSTAIDEAVSVIVPSRAVSELIRILGVFKENLEEKQTVEIRIGDNQILFAFENSELISRTIEGKYPDYRQLIPDRYSTEVVLTKDDLMRAVRATSLFSRTGLNDVHFSFSSATGIRLTAVNSQTGEHSVEVDGVVHGTPNEVTVNHKYFLDCVSSIEGEHVILQLNDGMSPCIVRGYQEGTPVKDHLYIVMPIRQ